MDECTERKKCLKRIILRRVGTQLWWYYLRQDQNVDVQNVDVQNVDVQNVDVQNVDVKNVDIQNVTIITSIFHHVNIDNVDINNVDIDNVDIDNVDIDNVDIDNVNIDNVDIVKMSKWLKCWYFYYLFQLLNSTKWSPGVLIQVALSMHVKSW